MNADAYARVICLSVYLPVCLPVWLFVNFICLTTDMHFFVCTATSLTHVALVLQTDNRYWQH